MLFAALSALCNLLPLFSPSCCYETFSGVGWAVLHSVCQEREGAGLVCVVTAQSTVT